MPNKRHFMEHSRVISSIVVTETGSYNPGSVPDDDESKISIDVTHRIILAAVDGDILVLDFNPPPLTGGSYTNLTTVTTGTSGANVELPGATYDANRKAGADGMKTLIGL